MTDAAPYQYPRRVPPGPASPRTANEAALELEQLTRKATQREQIVLNLRLAGYTFVEISAMLPDHPNAASLRQTFQRLVRKMRRQVAR